MHTNIEEVEQIIQSIDSKKATGLDGIPIRLIKECPKVVYKKLVELFNRSVDSGIFPDDLKLAKVTPIYNEANGREDLNNYRPISVVPAVAKIFEKIVFNQLYAYLSLNKLLSENQSGFRPYHSTTTALLDATNEWLTNMDAGWTNCVTLLDFTKAFDTVNHSILLRKLSYYGIADISVKWFESYLANRKQRCSINNTLSTKKNISIGIPQGSILGPLLFILYINDLPNSVKFSNVRMYADDTSLTTRGESQKSLISQANYDISGISNWLKANKLSLNATKTEHMFIASDDKLKQISSKAHVYIDGKQIKRVSSSKSLGVVIDERLSWADHVDYMTKKISSGLSGLRRVRDHIPQEIAIAIYKSLITPWFDYCDVVWDNLPKTSAERIQKLQNRAARIITRSGYDVRSKDILENLGWENLKTRRIKHKATVMFKTMNALAPQSLRKLFKTNENTYHLRGRENNLLLPKPKTNYLKKAFSYEGARAWNSLPYEIKSANNIREFRRELSSAEL